MLTSRSDSPANHQALDRAKHSAVFTTFLPADHPPIIWTFVTADLWSDFAAIRGPVCDSVYAACVLPHQLSHHRAQRAAVEYAERSAHRGAICPVVVVSLYSAIRGPVCDSVHAASILPHQLSHHCAQRAAVEYAERSAHRGAICPADVVPLYSAVR
jgi:hypothetical protein